MSASQIIVSVFGAAILAFAAAITLHVPPAILIFTILGILSGCVSFGEQNEKMSNTYLLIGVLFIVGAAVIMFTQIP